MTSIYEAEQAEEMNYKIAIARGWTDVRAMPEYYGIEPGGERSKRLSNWWQDLNEAMPLALELPQMTITVTSAGLYVEYRYAHEWAGWKADTQTSEALAQAICQAWLQWKGVK